MSSSAPPSSSKGIPIGLVAFIGIVSAIIWIGALLWQTSTSEIQVARSAGLAARGIMGVFNQWMAFIHGDLSATQDAAFIYAWGIEVFVLIGTTLWAIATAALSRGHPILLRLFGLLLVVCFLLDWGSDYLFLPASLGFWTRFLVSLLVAAAVAFLGVVAFACAEHCYKNW